METLIGKELRISIFCPEYLPSATVSRRLLIFKYIFKGVKKVSRDKFCLSATGYKLYRPHYIKDEEKNKTFKP